VSIKIMGLVWADRTGTITQSEASVLLRMADFAADDGSSVYPSLGRVADDVKMTRRGVINIVNSLQEKKILIKIAQAKPGDRMTCLYKINVEFLEQLKLQSESEIVNHVHPPSEPCSPHLVNHVHPPSEPRSPDPSINRQIDPSIKHPPTPQGGSAGFEKFWSLYPKKENKKKALATWVKLKLESQTEEIILGLEKHCGSEQWAKRGIIPHAKTFLNGERWKDELDPKPTLSVVQDDWQAKNKRIAQELLSHERLIWVNPFGEPEVFYTRDLEHPGGQMNSGTLTPKAYISFIPFKQWRPYDERDVITA